MGKFLAVASFYNNTEEHVRRTFDNVLNQTHDDWILIVGDDFSNDETFRRKLKQQVEELNDKRILYYPTKTKRELYLYQNTFQHLDYDYYFDLDADDIIDPHLFKIYDNHFQSHPDVESIFCDFTQVKENGVLEQWSAVQPVDDYLKEWNFRHYGEFWQIYNQRPTQKMFGVARAMRKPDVNSLPIIENCKTATDTYFLFYNLNRGKHLHIPRNLYTYIRRSGSDSMEMNDIEHQNFNLNAQPLMIEGLYGAEKVYEDIWDETTAISTCEWLNEVSEFSIISKKLTAVQLSKIRNLYPDKKVLLNQWHENIIVLPRKAESTQLEQYDFSKSSRVSALYINNNYEDIVDEDVFNIQYKEAYDDVSKWLSGFESYNFFRQIRFTVNRTEPQLKLDFDEVEFYYRSGPKLNCGKLPKGDWNAHFMKGDKLEWDVEICDGFWANYNEEWLQDWSLRIVDRNTGTIMKTITLDLNVFGIQIDSGSLGDTLSWMGQVEELLQYRDFKRILFRCHKPWLFDKVYYKSIGIEIVLFEEEWTQNWQTLGVYMEDSDISPKRKHKRDWRTLPLGAIAADQLGIPYKERKPKLNKKFYDTKYPVSNKSVCIATESTAQAKYWNRKGGWQSLINKFKAEDWQVYYVSKEPTTLAEVNHIPDIFEAGNAILNSNKFIGISSGMSWLAWALDVDVCMISGFTWEFVEFECNVRIINKSVCSGCWTWAEFDRGDWNWCPLNKDTKRQFECTKTITPEYVWQELETSGWFNI
jgi:autotransporter strand-loop-strand O-heptosyltransferase